MASRELYSSYVVPKRKFSLAHDILAANFNSAVAPIESMVGKNFFDPRVGSKDAAKMMGATDKAGGIANKGFWAYMSKGAAGKGKGMAAASSVAGAVPGEMNGTASAQPMEGGALNQQKQVAEYEKLGINTKNLDWLVDQANYNNPSPAGLTNSTSTFAEMSGQSTLGNQPVGPRYMAKGGKKYPRNTIITNNPNDPRIQRYKDSLNLYNEGELLRRDFDNQLLRGDGDYKIDEKTFSRLYKQYPNALNYIGSGSNNIVSYEIVRGNRYKKPVQQVVFEDKINKMPNKGLPTFKQLSPQMLNMPDRIEMDSRTGDEYKGIDVSHYTDALGRYTAKLNLSTTPGIKGKISYAEGGLRTFEGNSHAQGGIPLAGDEVEGKETMFPLDQQSDFIFSNQIQYPNSKMSFADKSKRISAKYKLRPNDPYGKKSEELELRNLAAQQEQIKAAQEAANREQVFAMGGKRYDDGGRFDIYPNYLNQLTTNSYSTNDLYAGQIPGRPISQEDELNIDYLPTNLKKIDTTPIGVPEATFGMYNDDKINRMTPKGAQINPSAGAFKTTPMELASKPNPASGTYNSNFAIPAAGYALQALTNIPALTTKAKTINSPRVKFNKLNLAEQRNEARRARNLALAMARGVGSNDAGQMMNYLSGTAANLNSVYGNQFNQTLLQEQQANIETNMREQLANSEIGRYDEQINAQERDAARALRMNALQNIGSIAATAGKDYLAMKENDAMMNVLMGSNPDYTYEVIDGKLVPIRRREKKAMGGRRTK